jgi:hypothetical protein
LGCQGSIIPAGVTSLANFAFFGHDYLTAVVIPNSVTTIGESVFFSCDHLESIVIPDSVTNIGRATFSNCYNLTNIKMPSNLTTIERNLFSGSGLTQIEIPSNVTNIGDSAFADCTSLTDVIILRGDNELELDGGNDIFTNSPIERLQVEDGHTVYESIDNTIIEIETDTVFLGCKNSIIPESATSIGKRAFSNCQGLTEINLPTSLLTIGYSAFSYCANLTSIEIPNSVTVMDHYAFAHCTSLTEVTFEEGSQIPILNQYVFYMCTLLENVDLPVGLTFIDGFAFGFCESLESITILNTITEIGTGAFSDCANLAIVEFEVDSNLATIQTEAFKNCENLTDINLPIGLTEISDGLFYGCTNLIINMPDNIIHIGENAFAYCTNAQSAIIPRSVTSIADGAFYGCENMIIIEIPGSVTSISDNAFYGCSALTIFAVADERPSGWSMNWNPNDCPIIWGTRYVYYVSNTTPFGGNLSSERHALISSKILIDGVSTNPREDLSLRTVSSLRLTNESFSNEGYSFVGWSLERSGEVIYSNGENIGDLGEITDYGLFLYAIWADMSELQSLVDELNALDPADYSTETWEPLAAELLVAEKMLTDAVATFAQIESEIDKLERLRDGLASYIDKTQLQGLVDLIKTRIETEEYQAEHFTRSSWSNLLSELATAEAVLLSDSVSQEQVTEEYIALNEVHAGLLNRGSFTALESLISEVRSLDPNMYSRSTYLAVNEELQQAVQFAERSDAIRENCTQDDIDVYYNSLADAYALLVRRANVSSLRILVAAAAAVKPEGYTSTSYADLAAALLTAKAIVLEVTEYGETTEEEVLATDAALSNAYAHLVLRGTANIAELERLITKADRLVPTDYRPSTWTGLAAPLTTAKTVANNVRSGEEVTHNTVFVAHNNLFTAITLLDFRANRAQLGALIERVKALDEVDYTAASWHTLRDQLPLSEDVYLNDEALDDDIITAYNDLNRAVINLVPTYRKSLQDLLDKISGLTESDYTLDSWSYLLTSKDDAVAAFENQDASDVDLLAAYYELKDAIDSLVLRASSNPTNNLIYALIVVVIFLLCFVILFPTLARKKITPSEKSERV